MALLPTKDRVLVKLDTPDERSRSNLIIIPHQARVTPFTATVMAIGVDQFDVKPGDRVVVSNFAGIEVPLDGKTYIMLDHSEIMALVEDGVKIDDHDHEWQLQSFVKYYACVCCGVPRRIDGVRTDDNDVLARKVS